MKSLLLSAAALALASATRRPAFQTDEFRALGRSDPKAAVSFTAALPMRNEALLESRLMAAADPDSPAYGQWMTQAEVNDLIAPEASVRAEVHAHLKRHGAKCIDWPSALRCKAPVAGVEKMLKTKMTVRLRSLRVFLHCCLMLAAALTVLPTDEQPRERERESLRAVCLALLSPATARYIGSLLLSPFRAHLIASHRTPLPHT